MKNIKYVIAFAIGGFLLSLLFGLFSHTSILIVLLKALIFGVVFGALGFAISFIVNKFLLDEGSGSGDLEIDVTNPGIQQRKNDNSTKGHLVDITIRDEELPLSNSDNHYVVGDRHQMLNENDYGHETTPLNQTSTNEDTDPNVSFRPVRNLETITNVSSKESVKPDANSSMQNVAKPDFNNQNASENEIDSLPDITGFAMDNAPKANSADIVEDVDAESGNEFDTTATRSMKSEGEVSEIKDAALFAKAISSVLSAEGS